MDWLRRLFSDPTSRSQRTAAATELKRASDETLQRRIESVAQRDPILTRNQPQVCQCSGCKSDSDPQPLLPRDDDSYSGRIGQGGRCNNCGTLVCSQFQFGTESCAHCGSANVFDDWVKYVNKRLEL